MFIHVNSEARSCNYYCLGKTVLQTYSQFVFVCVYTYPSFPARTAYATCLFSFVAFLAAFFHIISQMARLTEKRVMRITRTFKMCVLFFSTTWSEIYLILRRTEGDIIKNVHRLHAKYPLFFPELNT